MHVILSLCELRCYWWWQMKEDLEMKISAAEQTMETLRADAAKLEKQLVGVIYDRLIIIVCDPSVSEWYCLKWWSSGADSGQRQSWKYPRWVWGKQVHRMWYYPFIALTLLVGWQQGHLACKKTGCWFVGGDDLTGALHDL